MKKPLNFIGFILILLGHQFSFGQDLINLDSVSGTYILNNSSVAQAKTAAINNAKENALIRAGVPEQVLVYSTLESLETSDTLIETFSSSINIKARGNIIKWALLDEKKSINEFNNFTYDVVISATVVIYNIEADPSFNFEVYDLSHYYRPDENLTLRIKPSKSSFLHIYLLDKEKANQIYPNEYEKSLLMKKGIPYSFPSNPYINYSIFTEESLIEKNTLLIIITKEEHEIDFTTKQSVLQWAYTLPPDQVNYAFYPINIVED